MTVAGFAADGEEALALVAQIRPNVLLIDIAFPGVAAVEVTRRVVDDRRPLRQAS